MCPCSPPARQGTGASSRRRHVIIRSRKAATLHTLRLPGARHASGLSKPACCSTPMPAASSNSRLVQPGQTASCSTAALRRPVPAGIARGAPSASACGRAAQCAGTRAGSPRRSRGTRAPSPGAAPRRPAASASAGSGTARAPAAAGQARGVQRGWGSSRSTHTHQRDYATPYRALPLQQHIWPCHSAWHPIPLSHSCHPGFRNRAPAGGLSPRAARAPARAHQTGDVERPVRERGRGVVAADDAFQLLAQPVQVRGRALRRAARRLQGLVASTSRVSYRGDGCLLPAGWRVERQCWPEGLATAHSSFAQGRPRWLRPDQRV